MTESNKLMLSFYSRNLLTKRTSQQLLTFLEKFEEGILLPEKYDVKEPQRKIYANNQSDLIQLLQQPVGSVDIKRIKKNKYLFNITQSATAKKIVNELLEERSIKLVAHLWIDLGSESANYLHKMFTSLVDIFSADYAYACSEQEHEAKCFVTVKIKVGTITVPIGNNIEIEGIPDLFWLNYFGTIYSKAFPAQLSKLEEPASTTKHKSGILLQFDQDPSKWKSTSISESKQKTKNLIGTSWFADLTDVKMRLEQQALLVNLPDTQNAFKKAKTPPELQ